MNPSTWKVKVAQSGATLCDPTVPGILQARILEWVAVPFSRGSSQPRDQTHVSCITGRFFTSWPTREAPSRWKIITKRLMSVSLSMSFKKPHAFYFRNVNQTLHMFCTLIFPTYVPPGAHSMYVHTDLFTFWKTKLYYFPYGYSKLM